MWSNDAVTTIYEVAAHAGVSAATVSRVLNGNRAVNEAMAAKVRQAIEALGYRPSSVARSLRTQRTGIIAVVVPDVENPFFTAVVRGIEEEARPAGLMIVLCNTDEQPDLERGYLRLAVDQRMDGVILASTIRSLEERQAEKEPLLTTVLIDREIEGLRADVVLTDNVLGAKEATRHLLRSGAATVACVTGPTDLTTSMQRLQGYLEALGDAGIGSDRALFRHANYRVSGGRAAVGELWAAARPDAFLVCNNLMTMGALQELSDRGVRMPEDVLLLGFDDEPWASYWRPTISTVAQPARDVGRTAMRLLLDRLGEPERPVRRVLLLPELRLRQSSHREFAPSAGHQSE